MACSQFPSNRHLIVNSEIEPNGIGYRDIFYICFWASPNFFLQFNMDVMCIYAVLHPLPLEPSLPLSLLPQGRPAVPAVNCCRPVSTSWAGLCHCLCSVCLLHSQNCRTHSVHVKRFSVSRMRDLFSECLSLVRLFILNKDKYYFCFCFVYQIPTTI